METKNWSIPDEKGIVNVPDELEALVNYVGMQLRFHTISGKTENATIVSIVYKSQKFFEDLWKDKLKSELNEGA